jgi:hypothetical protein
MKHRYIRLGIVTLTIIGISFGSGCINQEPQESGLVEATLDSPFQLQINQAAMLESENLKIRFSSVTEDSRCATGHQCIWAGRGTIVVDVFKNEQSLGAFSLSTEGGVDTTTFDEYSLNLVSLDPYPVANQTISLSEYTATLVASKT